MFGYQIKYTEVDGLETPDPVFNPGLKVKPRYNGNIAEVEWKTALEYNEPLKRYGYVYDPLNRLLAGFYQKAGSETAREYMELMSYDLNGNITNLKRSEGLLPGNTSATMIDNLLYDYTGNQLQKVTDEQIGNNSGYPSLSAHNTILYDANGNMTKHADKGLSNISYNFLNLPNRLQKGSGMLNTGHTSYLYRADGTKVNRILENIAGTTGTDYLDGFQYSYQGADNCIGCPPAAYMLNFVPTAEGYFDYQENLYIYHYVDHLGNVRLSYADANGDGTITPRDMFIKECQDVGNGDIACLDIWKPGEIVENNTYYPFGLMHNYIGTSLNAYQYKYNGKELQETGMYDYGARFYMPDIGRWGVVDPLAETSRRWSPYTYAYNNPIRFIDPDGMQNEDWIRQNGVWKYDEKITTVEQAQKMADVDGFAKNGTVLANANVNGGEAGHVRLNAGGTADYLPNSNGSASLVAFSNSMPMFMGGTWTTWTHEDFPQITNNGGLARSDFDASSWDKFRPGDKLFNIDMGSFVQPGALPNGSSFGERFSAFAERVKSVLDVVTSNDKAKSDSTYSSRLMIQKGGGTVTDTIFRYHNSADSLQQIKTIDSIGTYNFLKGWGKVK